MNFVLAAITIAAFVYAIINLVKYRRNKTVIVKSMAQSFIVMFILNALHLAGRWIGGEGYAEWWANFTAGIFIDPSALSLIVLGIVLFINKKRHRIKTKQNDRDRENET